MTIGSAVDSIGDLAFYGNRLTSVKIPISVQSIGLFAFAGNPNLTTVTISQALYDRLKVVRVVLYSGVSPLGITNFDGTAITP